MQWKSWDVTRRVPVPVTSVGQMGCAGTLLMQPVFCWHLLKRYQWRGLDEWNAGWFHYKVSIFEGVFFKGTRRRRKIFRLLDIENRENRYNVNDMMGAILMIALIKCRRFLTEETIVITAVITKMPMQIMGRFRIMMHFKMSKLKKIYQITHITWINTVPNQTEVNNIHNKYMEH